MGIGRRLKRLARGAANVARETVSDATQNPIDVVRGKKGLDEVVKDTTQNQLDAAKIGTDLASVATQEFSTLVVKLGEKVGGEQAKDLIADATQAVSYVNDPKYGSVLIDGLKTAVEDGKFDQLNPFAIWVAAQADLLRERLWDSAKPIPQEILARFPGEVRQIANGVRWILERDIPGNFNMAHASIQFSGHADAMTLGELIIWDEIPLANDESSLHLWVHELFHVQQYRAGGTLKFMTSYLGNEFGFDAQGTYDENGMEVAADLFACKFFPNGQPSYLPGNRCP